ncbi:NAD(P)/FAD-dependent oxidoreductase [Paenibacillus arenilitoris]|uniref:FAD-dependent oxidoreductase n=1 Tax=Paenibacillus arenilitoris TaxID=2772299 RepID=A0A927H8K1_9BACL|nr:FAD-dependent oxidoreductase [Paenibacillus arenilitoris]MBD2872821.1 FAD-dependent oxidoreductase [Paenibacillus arenilitoris]
MKPKTFVVVGGGYAGIHAVRSLQKGFREELRRGLLKLVLIDKQAYHLRKVLLFKPAAAREEIKIPFRQLFPEGVELVRGAVTRIESADKSLLCQDENGAERRIGYDVLVLAAGSVVRQPEPEAGGIALTGVDAAIEIREAWLANLKQAAGTQDERERRRLLTIAVAGAGISGIETAAELAHYVRVGASVLGLDPAEVKIRLLNAHDRLFGQGPAKVGQRLEAELAERGVAVIHGCRAVREKEGVLALSSGESMPVGLCIWSLGLQPNPMLRSIGVPLTPDGYVAVDASYRVQGAHGVYSIGDCAHIRDASGKTDGKTCKEASAQAVRLAKVIEADIEGRSAPAHKPYADVFCFGLGPEQGLVWTRQWGLDFIIARRLGWRIRKLTWDVASLLK